MAGCVFKIMQGLCLLGVGIGVGVSLTPRPVDAGITVFDPVVNGQILSNVKAVRDVYSAAREQISELQGMAAMMQGHVSFVQSVAQNPQGFASEVTGCLFSFSLGEVNPPRTSVCDVTGWAIQELTLDAEAVEGSGGDVREARGQVERRRKALADEGTMRAIGMGRFLVGKGPDDAQQLAVLTADATAAAGDPGNNEVVQTAILLRIARDLASIKLALGTHLELAGATEAEGRPVVFKSIGKPN